MIPIKELKSTPFKELIELESTITPHRIKRVFHIIERKKLGCLDHESFATLKNARFVIAWPEVDNKKLKETIKKKISLEISFN